MLVRIVMWIGAGLIIIGVIGLIILFVSPLIKAIKTVFFRQQYDQSEEREDVEKGRKLLKKALIILIGFGFVLFVPSVIFIHAPRGPVSILVPSIDDSQNSLKVVTEPEEMQDDQTVIVEGKTIHFNGRSFEDTEEFGVYLDIVDKVQEIRLKDEYAVAATFHQAESVLKEKGIRYVYFEEAKGTE